MHERATRWEGALGLLAVLFAQGCLGSGSVEAVGQDNESLRWSMVERQIAGRGVEAPAVLHALRKVPRHLFVPSEHAAAAYDDHPLPIGYDQTISQPYIVAFMTELLDLNPESKVLEIGTGSGYQAAVLAEVAGAVFSIEIVEPLAERSSELLSRLGYTNVTVRAGDGYQGWAEEAPFDAIILTAAPPSIPPPLLEQLGENGRLIAPVGRVDQELILITKGPGGLERRDLIPVRFVPMTGEAQNP